MWMLTALLYVLACVAVTLVLLTSPLAARLDEARLAQQSPQTVQLRTHPQQ